ncbi:MAG: hypothetical protein MUE56_04325 [Ignavibacteria bacterium]|nr:hypothetical protein [Ignavibacteria bacterium]
MAYNSEHVPMLLITVAYFLFFKTQYFSFNDKTKKSVVLYYFLYGIVVGLLPFAKLQAVAFSFSFFIGMFFINLFSKENVTIKNIVLIAGVMLPVLILISYLFLFNLTSAFWNYYILNNLDYGSDGLYTYSKSWLIMKKGENAETWIEKIFVVPELIQTTKDTILYFGSLLFISSTGMIIMLKNRRIVSAKNKYVFLFLLFNFIMGYFSVIVTGNIFLHYLILLVVPLLFLAGFLLNLIIDVYRMYSDKISVYLKYYVLLTVLLPSIIFAIDGNSYIREYIKLHPRENKSDIGELLKKYSQPGDKLAVWGFLNNIYIEAGLIQGTREPFSVYQISEGKRQNYFIEKYCEDIILHKPDLFVDAVGKNSVFYYDYKYRFENYPVIKELINRNYNLIDTIEDTRIFVIK